MSVPLPHSGKGPYRGNYWGTIEKDMNSLIKNPFYDRLEELIIKYIGRNEEYAQFNISKLENLR